MFVSRVILPDTEVYPRAYLSDEGEHSYPGSAGEIDSTAAYVGRRASCSWKFLQGEDGG